VSHRSTGAYAQRPLVEIVPGLDATLSYDAVVCIVERMKKTMMMVSALVLGGCGANVVVEIEPPAEEPPSELPDAGAESLKDCPLGAMVTCNTGDTQTRCLLGGAPRWVCSKPAGILVTYCAATCASSVCALSPAGVLTCCEPGADDPCNERVP
jgi:hypothetical protein